MLSVSLWIPAFAGMTLEARGDDGRARGDDGRGRGNDIGSVDDIRSEDDNMGSRDDRMNMLLNPYYVLLPLLTALFY